MGVRRWLQAGCGIPHDGAHDTIVVLGGHPSVRCPAAVELWQAGRAPCITIVGGRLTDGVPTEVRKSAAVLHSLGMPGDAVRPVLDPAPGTWEEASVVARLAQDNAWTSIVVVTSPYHCRRAGQMFRRLLPGRCAVSMVACDEPGWDRVLGTRRLRKLVGIELLKWALWRMGVRERLPRSPVPTATRPSGWPSR